MPARFSTAQPRTLTEACEALAACTGTARLHAGGTDVMVQVREGGRVPDLLVDLSRIDGLAGVERLDDGTLRIGARVPMTQLIEDPAMDGAFEGLRDAMKLVGSIQIRNRATLAGNICNASPAGDTLPVLVVLGARVNLISTGGTRTVPVAEFVAGPGRVDRERDEVVASIDIPAPRGRSASAYLRSSRRRAVDLALTGVAVCVDETGSVAVSYCAVGPRPVLGERAASALEGIVPGRTPDDDPPELREAARAATEEITPIDDVRASAEYRRAMTAVFLIRSYRLAWHRLHNTTTGSEGSST